MAIFRFPAVCKKCHLVFFSGFAFGVGSNPSLSGNTSQCPRCGGIGQVPDGALEILKDGIRVFSAPDFTVEVLRTLQLNVEDLRAGRTTAREVAASLDHVHPGVANEFREWSSWGFNFIAAMAAVAAVVLAWQDQPSSNRTIEEAAVDGFESIYQAPQLDLRPFRATTTRLRGGGNFVGQPNIATSTREIKPNRKQRRAAMAKERKPKGR